MTKIVNWSMRMKDAADYEDKKLVKDFVKQMTTDFNSSKNLKRTLNKWKRFFNENKEEELLTDLEYNKLMTKLDVIYAKRTQKNNI